MAAAYIPSNFDLKPSREHQYNEDYQDDANDADAAMTIAITVAAEAATEPADQKDYENDDKNESKRHGAVLSETPISLCCQDSIQAISTTPVCTEKLDADVVVMKSAKDRV
jgi:hypothetical protein